MLSALKDLFHTLGTDWGMWLMFLVALVVLVTVAKWVFRISGFIGDKVSR